MPYCPNLYTVIHSLAGKGQKESKKLRIGFIDDIWLALPGFVGEVDT